MKIDLKDRIIEFKPDQADWTFDLKGPKFSFLRKDHDWKYFSSELDPFPCYTHDKNIILSETERIESIFPIKFNTYYFILPYEATSRTNGWAEKNNIWCEEDENKDQKAFRPNITFSGKRIPPMTSMTKYLCGHEYGHVIDYWIVYNMGFKDAWPTPLDEEYASLLKIPCNDEYGALKWHSNIGEIIANSIRIVLFNCEIDFWPHDIEHPLKNKKVIDFWNKMRDKYIYEG